MSRDGSLTSKKQAQWERERAENQSVWFPFGRPGCGSPNKRAEIATSPSHCHLNSPSAQEVKKNDEENADFRGTFKESPGQEDEPKRHFAPLQPSNPLISPGLCYINPLLPYQSYPLNMPSTTPSPVFTPMYMYNVIPQGAMPVPLQFPESSIREQMCPVTLLQNLQHYQAVNLPRNDAALMGNSVADYQETQEEACSLSAISPKKAEKEDWKNDDSSAGVSSCRDNLVSLYETDEGACKRLEQLEFRQREEELRQEEKEDELRKSMDKRHEAVVKALEKAQKEAEILRKAKIYKHIIDGCTEKEIIKDKLGVDSETGEEALKTISLLEKQRKAERESQKRQSPMSKKKVDLNDNHLSNSIRSRSSSFSNSEAFDTTFSVYKEEQQKENFDVKRLNNQINREPLKKQSMPDTGENFRRTRSLRLPNRMTTSFTEEISNGPYTVPSSVMNPLFSPISTRTRRMRATTDDPMSPNGCENMMSVSKAENLQSPIPRIMVESERTTPISAAEELFSRMRSKSTLSSYSSSSSPNTPLTSVYARKLVEKGCTKHGEDRLSPDIRRHDEANLSRQSSVTSLKGSLCNLRGSVQNLNATMDSPNLGKYRSMNPSYRSFNLKKTSERQKETLERLAKLREQLHSKENFNSHLVKI